MTPYTIIIPAAGNAAGVATVHASGKYFLVTATTGAFSVITSNSDEFDFSETGSGFGNDSAPRFGKLTFYNAGGVAVTITFYVSDSPIKTPDVSVNSTVNVTASLTNTLPGDALEVEGQFQKNTGGLGAAVAFAAAGNYFRRAIIIAERSLNGSNVNIGTVYIGNSAANQPIKLSPGDLFTIEADTGGKRDFGSWYVSADNGGDGISVLYV
jgi:hypothetical protein